MWPFDNDKDEKIAELEGKVCSLQIKLDFSEHTCIDLRRAAENFAEFQPHRPWWSGHDLGLTQVRTLKDADARIADLELYIQVLEECMSERDISAAKSLFERLMKVKCPQSEGDEGVL